MYERLIECWIRFMVVVFLLALFAIPLFVVFMLGRGFYKVIRLLADVIQAVM